MRCCRICRTEKNLKYTDNELRKQNRYRNGLHIMSTPSTWGNICYDCEERLHNYQQLDEDEGSIIVDDDELLYNFILKKKSNSGPPDKTQVTAAQHSALNRVYDDGGNVEEVIEVLTSRENTPSPVVPPATVATVRTECSTRKAAVEHKIVAVIDLDAEDECLSSVVHLSAVSSSEKFVLRNVESQPECAKFIASTKRKTNKKRDGNRDFRLIASLNLVSSDESDLDEVIPSKHPTKVAAKPTIKQMPKKRTSPSSLGLQTHERLNTIVKCPVCQSEFPASQRLIHHMRCRHRSYDGDVLCERPRCAQDSAMTIRLRYLKRYMYYECQLCGRIDAIFKEHKQHVIEKHAAESKSLKDPMMQILKCPVCKEKCGTQYVLLCRHMLGTHTAAEYKMHLKEVTQVRNTFSWNASRQKEMRRSARIFQFPKRKNYFFECKMCQKVVTGYHNHQKHLNTHTRNAIVTSSNNKERVVQAKKSKANGEVHRKKKTTCVSPRVPNVSKKFSEPKAKVVQKRQRHRVKRKAQSALVKVKVKPPLRRFPTQYYKCRWCAEFFRGFYRLNLHQISAHSDLEYWRCDSCAFAFSTTSALAAHAKQHSVQKKRKDSNARKLVDENCNTDCGVARRRLDCINIPFNSSRGATAQALQESDTANTATVASSTWLQDLMLLQAQRHSNRKLPNDCGEGATGFSTAHQCSYCTHLFLTMQELHEHEAQHVQQRSAPVIRRLMTNMTTNVTAMPGKPAIKNACKVLHPHSP